MVMDDFEIPERHRDVRPYVNPLDLLIAVTAKAKGLILATLNIRHFNIIPGLAVEDWSQI